MPQYIIHKDGAYNIFSTVVDAPIFAEALTLEQLRDWYGAEYGRQGLEELPPRLERAVANGTSSMIGHTLEDHIRANRAGENEAELSHDDFIRQYLTLRANACFAKTCNYTESGFANPTPKLNQALIVGREVEVDDAVQDPINQT